MFSDNVKGVEHVKTKRGTELFFHSRCTKEVWNHRIV